MGEIPKNLRRRAVKQPPQAPPASAPEAPPEEVGGMPANKRPVVKRRKPRANRPPSPAPVMPQFGS